MRLAGPLLDFRPDGAVIMFELLASTQRRAFPLMIFLSKSERNLLCKCCAPDLKDYRAGVMDVEDKDEIQ